MPACGRGRLARPRGFNGLGVSLGVLFELQRDRAAASAGARARQVGTLHEAFFVDHQQAGQVHLGGHLGRGGGLGDGRRIQRTRQFGFEPAAVAGVGRAWRVRFRAGRVLRGRYGRRPWRRRSSRSAQRCCAVRLMARAGGPVSAAASRRPGALLALPVAIGAVGQGAQRGHAAVHGDLAADLAGLLAAQQQSQERPRPAPPPRPVRKDDPCPRWRSGRASRRRKSSPWPDCSS